MSMSTTQPQFSFSKVTLLKDQALGTGSYGSFCKAKCDTLTCAAKIIHPLLFDLADPGVRSMLNRFQQECQLLAAIKHPNIVQYLGTHTDPDTGLPVLLMELMDSSLTHFLDSSPQPLPLHLQLDLSLDVATALAYLHSNNIQHRDLSSNNILLLGHSRAKVTDFGMSRLEKVNPRMTPATTCPGTLCYMPPEALRERPLHTDKLDVFSFGVLLLQILIRKFPEPSDRFTSLLVPDPRNKGQTIEAQVLVKEVERREKHISLVGGSPLLPVALACLEDRQEDRPAATLLCTQLEERKSLDEYRSSVEENRMPYHKLQTECEEQEVAIEELRGKLAEKVKEKETLQRALADKNSIIEEMDNDIKKQESSLTKSSDSTVHWIGSESAPVKFKGPGHVAVAGNLVYFHETSSNIHQFDSETESWSTLPDPPTKAAFTIIVIHDLFLTTVGGDSKTTAGKLYTYMGSEADKAWVEKFPPSDCVFSNPAVVSTFDRVIVIGRPVTGAGGAVAGAILDLEILEWTRFTPSRFIHPSSDFHASMFVQDSTVYYRSGDAFSACSLSEIKDSKSWRKLHPLLHTRQAVVGVKDYILGLGGKEGAEKLKTIYRYEVDADRWVEFGEMEVACCDCMVGVVGNKMVVVGDDGGRRSITHIATIV